MPQNLSESTSSFTNANQLENSIARYFILVQKANTQKEHRLGREVKSNTRCVCVCGGGGVVGHVIIKEEKQKGNPTARL